jgi:hypothetical protein
VIFALLDAMYLALEREYRALYKRAVVGKAETWSLSPSDVGVGELLSALFSWSVLPIYLAGAAGAAVVAAGG